MRAGEPDFGTFARRSVLWTLCLGAMLGLGLFWFGTSEAAARLERIGPRVLSSVLGLSLLNYMLRAGRWQRLSQALGVRVPFVRNALYFLAGFAFAVTPGKLGEVVRLWLLRRHHGTAYSRTAGLLVMDRVTDAVPLLALCLLGTSQFAGQDWSTLAVVALMLGGLALFLCPGWLALVIKLIYARVRRRPRLFGRGLRLVRALRALTAPAVLAQALVLGVLGWTAEIAGACLVLDALGAEVGTLATVFVFTSGMLVGALPLFPGGIGGAESTMIGLLLICGVDFGTAVSATVVIRLTTLWFAVVLGFLVLPFALNSPQR